MTRQHERADDDRYYALGQVVEMAAVLEISLRMTFCALVGGKYAAVLAGAQETHWLIETCDAVARHRDDLTAGQRQAIHAALHACREANRDRNRLVHDAWNAAADGTPALIKSSQRSYRITGRAWSTSDIRAATFAIEGAQQALLAAAEDALGTASLQAAEQLLAANGSEYRG